MKAMMLYDFGPWIEKRWSVEYITNRGFLSSRGFDSREKARQFMKRFKAQRIFSNKTVNKFDDMLRIG